MIPKSLRLAASALAVLISSAALTPPILAQTVTALPQFDLKLLTGTWYEVAYLPTKAQKKCIGTPLALYALGDKPLRVQVVNSCPAANGASEVRNANAKVEKKGPDSKLKVTYTWPFSTRQWVLAKGPDTDWLLIGSPNHKNLSLLTRTATVTPEILADARARATAQGFDTAKLLTPAPQPAVVRSSGPGAGR